MFYKYSRDGVESQFWILCSEKNFLGTREMVLIVNSYPIFILFLLFVLFIYISFVCILQMAPALIFLHYFCPFPLVALLVYICSSKFKRWFQYLINFITFFIQYKSNQSLFLLKIIYNSTRLYVVYSRIYIFHINIYNNIIIWNIYIFQLVFLFIYRILLYRILYILYLNHNLMQ